MNGRWCCLIKLTTLVLSVSLVTSCTRDAFFGLEEEYDGFSYSKMYEIANSKEYINYQTEVLLAREEINNIDTTNKVMVGSYEGRIIYSIGSTGSIKPLLEARKQLLDSYPDYNNATFEDMQQMFNVAIMNNRELRNLISKISTCADYMTKGNNGETDAWRWIMSSSIKPDEPEGNTGGYPINYKSTHNIWYFHEDYWVCICEAIYLAGGEQKEHGGYCWESDGSGVRVFDINRLEDEMHRVFFAVDPKPTFEFHVHPSGNLSASNKDWSSWSLMSTSVYHRIYDTEGNYKTYSSVFPEIDIF